MNKITICKSDDLIEVKVDVDGVRTTFTCRYFSKLQLHRILNNPASYSYRSFWRDEDDLLARVCLEFLKEDPISTIKFEVNGFSDFKEYAKNYLQVYFARACFEAALKFIKIFGYISILKPQYDYDDYLAIAWEKMSDPLNLFKDFSLTTSSKISKMAIQKLLFHIRTKIEQEVPEFKQGKYQNYGLLKNISRNPKKDLEPALKSWGLSEQEIEQMVLTWRCFKEIYAQKTNRPGDCLPAPTDDEYEQIAQRYNVRKSELSIITEEINAEDVKTNLQTCIDALDSWLWLGFDNPDSDDNSEFKWDEISSYNYHSSQTPKSDLPEMVAQSFYKLSPYDQGILETLDFGLGITQSNMSKVLEIDQTNVGRHRKSALKRLFTNFIALWNQKYPKHQFCKKKSNKFLAIFSTTRTKLEQEQKLLELKQELEETLKDVCHARISNYLDDICESLTPQEQSLLTKFELSKNTQNYPENYHGDLLVLVEQIIDKIVKIYTGKLSTSKHKLFYEQVNQDFVRVSAHNALSTWLIYNRSSNS